MILKRITSHLGRIHSFNKLLRNTRLVSTSCLARHQKDLITNTYHTLKLQKTSFSSLKMSTEKKSKTWLGSADPNSFARPGRSRSEYLL